MQIKAVAHVCLKTSDLAATIAFYRDALGLRKVFDFTRKGQIIGCYLQAANETFVEIFLTENPETTGANYTLQHFCLETDAIEQLRERLLDAGFSPGKITLGADQTLQFWVADPNGLAVEIQQYTDRSAQFSGADVEVDW